jgi:hypothetical protein
MPVKDTNSPAKYRWRVKLLRPVNVVNDYNESQTSFEVAYNNYPAMRKDSVTADNEDQTGQVIQATNVVEWELRFIPNLGIKTSWKMIDVFSGQEYEIVSPVTEVGFRQGYRVKTKIVE